MTRTRDRNHIRSAKTPGILRLRVPAPTATILLVGVADGGLMREPEDPDERVLGELVLAYLDEHPQAMETLDGIAEWWIERRRIRVNVEALARALTHLTEAGALEVVGEGPARRYRRRTPTHQGN